MYVDWITFTFRTLLGILFVVSAVEGWIYILTGRDFSAKPPLDEEALTFVSGLRSAKWFWGYMKGIDLVAGMMLLLNIYANLGLLLLLPVISVICMFYIFMCRRAWWVAPLLAMPTGWLLFVYWLSPVGIGAVSSTSPPS